MQTDTSPAENAVVVDVSSVDQPVRARALHIGGAGTVYVDMQGVGTNIPFVAVAGQILPYAVKKIYHAGTTATGIVAVY